MVPVHLKFTEEERKLLENELKKAKNTKETWRINALLLSEFYEVKEPSKREIELIYDVQAFNALEWNASNEMVFAKESEYLEKIHALW